MVTLHGIFPSLSELPDQLTVMLKDASATSSSQVYGLNVHYLTQSSIAFTLPARPRWSSPIESSSTTITVRWNNTNSDHGTVNEMSSNSLLRMKPWDYEDAPRITTVTGCGRENDSTLVLTTCTGGELITLYGIRFARYNYSLLMSLEGTGTYSTVPCASSTVVDDRIALCELLYVELVSNLQYGQRTRLRLSQLPRSSNLVDIAFTLL